MTRLLFHIISYSAFLKRLSSLVTELDITTQHRSQRKFKKKSHLDRTLYTDVVFFSFRSFRKPRGFNYL